MKITTPSGYEVTFKDRDDLTYGDVRRIQKAMLKDLRLKEGEDLSITGDMIFSGQDEMLKIILKEIKRPDGTVVKENLYDEVMGWKKDDGEAVFQVVNDTLSTEKKK